MPFSSFHRIDRSGIRGYKLLISCVGKTVQAIFLIEFLWSQRSYWILDAKDHVPNTWSSENRHKSVNQVDCETIILKRYL